MKNITYKVRAEPWGEVYESSQKQTSCNAGYDLRYDLVEVISHAAVQVGSTATAWAMGYNSSQSVTVRPNIMTVSEYKEDLII